MPFDVEDVRRWMPVTQYVGGAEHAILHLLYSRFVTKVLHDAGLVDPVEPFASLLNQGHVLNQGKAMSKSLGNGVALGEQLDEYGVDAVRLTMVFAGAPEDDIDWADLSPGGMRRFLARALRLATDVQDGPVDDDLRRLTHRTVDDCRRLLDASRFNVVVARVMALVSAARRAIDAGSDAREAVEVVAVLLSLVAPYTAEEMWEALGHEPSVASAGWPDGGPDAAGRRDRRGRRAGRRRAARPPRGADDHGRRRAGRAGPGTSGGPARDRRPRGATDRGASAPAGERRDSVTSGGRRYPKTS